MDQSIQKKFYLATAFLLILVFLPSIFNSCSSGFQANRGKQSASQECPVEDHWSSPVFGEHKVVLSLSHQQASTQMLSKGTKLVVVIDNQCLQIQNLQSAEKYPLLASALLHKPETSELSQQAFSFDLSENTTLRSLEDQAQNTPCLVGISHNRQYKTTSPTVARKIQTPFNDSYFSQQAHFTALDATLAYEKFYDPGSGIEMNNSSQALVAIIDTGVDYNHPDLNSSMWKHNLGYGYNAPAAGTNEQYDPIDQSHASHGTHVAGIVAATTNNGRGVAGVAPYGTQIMAVNVFDNDTSTTEYVVNGMNFALTHGADVINLSLGTLSDEDADDPVYVNALNQVIKAGIVVVTAAGNATPEFPQQKLGPTGVTVIPAKYGSSFSGMLTVGSFDTSSLKYSAFSHYSTQFVEIAAPGAYSGLDLGILSTTSPTLTGSYYMHLPGTSMAAPMVSAAASLVIQLLKRHQISYTPALIEDLLVKGAISSNELMDQVKLGRQLNLMSLYQEIAERFPDQFPNPLGEDDPPSRPPASDGSFTDKELTLGLNSTLSYPQEGSDCL